MTGDSFPALIQPTHLSVGEMGVQTGRGWLPEASAAGRIRGAYRPTDSFTASDLLRGPLKLWGKSPEGRRGPEARHKATIGLPEGLPQGRGQPRSSAGTGRDHASPFAGFMCPGNELCLHPFGASVSCPGPIRFCSFPRKSSSKAAPCQVQQQHPYFARLRHGALALWDPRGQKPEQLWLQASSHQEDT